MSGKTQIDIDLRNQLVEFIGDLDLQGEQALKAQDLYGRLKPQRIRKTKVVVNG